MGEDEVPQFRHSPTPSLGKGGINHDRNTRIYCGGLQSKIKEEDITELNKDWQIGYKRQMEVYQWLLRQNGYKVSDTGYFVHCNGQTDRKAFDGKLEFDVTLISYKGDDSWVEGAIKSAHKCLNSDKNT